MVNVGEGVRPQEPIYQPRAPEPLGSDWFWGPTGVHTSIRIWQGWRIPWLSKAAACPDFLAAYELLAKKQEKIAPIRDQLSNGDIALMHRSPDEVRKEFERRRAAAMAP